MKELHCHFDDARFVLTQMEPEVKPFFRAVVRIDRSYIINVNSVKRIQENWLWVDDHEIPIGKTYKNEIPEIFRFI